MRINAHLSFAGRCEEAFRLYERVLGGTVAYMARWGETPAAELVPPDWRDKIIHATLNIGSDVIMGADAPEDRQAAPQGFAVALHLDDVAQAERIYTALAEGGTATMPLEKTFWAERFGMLTDRFGIPWMINCGQAT